MQHSATSSRILNGQPSILPSTYKGVLEMKTRKALLSLLLITLFQVPFAYAQEPSLQGFDEYINKALKDWEVPGVAIAIIKNDKIILAKGYGVRKLGDSTPVNERTVFAIG